MTKKKINVSMHIRLHMGTCTFVDVTVVDSIVMCPINLYSVF